MPVLGKLKNVQKLQNFFLHLRRFSCTIVSEPAARRGAALRTGRRRTFCSLLPAAKPGQRGAHALHAQSPADPPQRKGQRAAAWARARGRTLDRVLFRRRSLRQGGGLWAVCYPQGGSRGYPAEEGQQWHGLFCSVRSHSERQAVYSENIRPAGRIFSECRAASPAPSGL